MYIFNVIFLYLQMDKSISVSPSYSSVGVHSYLNYQFPTLPLSFFCTVYQVRNIKAALPTGLWKPVQPDCYDATVEQTSKHKSPRSLLDCKVHQTSSTLPNISCYVTAEQDMVHACSCNMGVWDLEKQDHGVQEGLSSYSWEATLFTGLAARPIAVEMIAEILFFRSIFQLELRFSLMNRKVEATGQREIEV